MTLICDFCKKPLKTEENKSMTFGATTLDFHEECGPKFIDRIINPPPPPPPSPTPAQIERARLHHETQQASGFTTPPKRSFWGGKPKKKKAAQMPPQFEDLEEESLVQGFP